MAVRPPQARPQATRRPGAVARAARTALTLSALACLTLAGSGCAIAAIIGGAAESYHRTGSTTYPADYEGLSRHSYAVLVNADRVIEAEHPGLVARVAGLVNRNLAENANASAFIPTTAILNAQLNNPQWQFMPRGDVAEILGVQRLVTVEIVEYRLTEAGNAYLWSGVAEALVEVYEADGPIPDEPSYDRRLSVAFPDVTGVLREEVPETIITSELSRRLTDRISWLFYEHDEPNAITY